VWGWLVRFVAGVGGSGRVTDKDDQRESWTEGRQIILEFFRLLQQGHGPIVATPITQFEAILHVPSAFGFLPVHVCERQRIVLVVALLLHTFLGVRLCRACGPVAP
jgi:hypothetical protein